MKNSVAQLLMPAVFYKPYLLMNQGKANIQMISNGCYSEKTQQSKTIPTKKKFQRTQKIFKLTASASMLIKVLCIVSD